jgi:phage tail sheath protein FI
VRRYLVFVERSVCEGTQWFVFEPNDGRLWAKLTNAIRLSLISQWRPGALSGRGESDAFFVRCNETTMTQDDIRKGGLICHIGVAPVRPADFAIFRLCQDTTEATSRRHDPRKRTQEISRTYGLLLCAHSKANMVNGRVAHG